MRWAGFGLSGMVLGMGGCFAAPQVCEPCKWFVAWKHVGLSEKWWLFLKINFFFLRGL